jgi:nucleobase:cation symporter-1, NCS1 family
MSQLLKDIRAFGIEPVPREHRVLGVRDNFVLWADLAVSFLVMVVGMFLVPGLGFRDALLAIVVGALVGNLLLGLAAIVGSDTGLPTMVLLRASLGRVGSYVPTIVNVVQLIGWATFEVIVMAQAADLLATTQLHLPSAYGVWVLFFSALTLLLAIGGPLVVTKQWMEKFAVWVVLITTIWITVALLSTYDVGTILSKPGTGEMSFWLAVDLVVALPISWFPLVADYSRFSRDRRSAFWGTAAGYFVPQVWFYALGVLLVLVAGVASDPNAPIAPLLAAISGLTVGWAALLVLLLDETDEGFADVYSTALSIQNLWPRLSQRGLITALCGLVLVIAWLVPLAQYESFLLLIGAVFVPLLAIVCADYFFIRGRRYEADELLHGRASPAVRWGAMATWLLGIAVYLLISGLPPFGIDGLAPWLGASLPSFVVTFVVYVAVERLVVRRRIQTAGAMSA